LELGVHCHSFGCATSDVLPDAVPGTLSDALPDTIPHRVLSAAAAAAT
jgi:hypothetical protein